MVQIDKTFEGKIVIIFLPINLNMCFELLGAQKNRHGDGAFEYPQHMLWLERIYNRALLSVKYLGYTVLYGKCTEMSNTSSFQKGIDKQCRPRSDYF